MVVRNNTEESGKNKKQLSYKCENAIPPFFLYRKKKILENMGALHIQLKQKTSVSRVTLLQQY